MVLLAAGMRDLLLWGIIGTVILDIDVIFSLFSDPYPSLFIFSHGGFTHSLLGAVLVSVVIFFIFRHILTSLAVRKRIFLQFPDLGEFLPSQVPAWVVIVVMAGAFLHLGLDCCATPGLPLLYPLSVHKYALGMLSGSILILFVTSLGFLGLLLWGRVNENHLKIYAVIFLIILLVSGGLKVYVSSNTEGRTLSTLNPLSWLVIRENNTAYTVEEYEVFWGIISQTSYVKYQNITPSDILAYDTMPEVKRLNYFSYITVVEKNETQITFSDPLREHRIIWYPPYYSQVRFMCKGSSYSPPTT